MKIFSTKRFIQECAEAGVVLDDVREDFRRWKELGIYPATFGSNFKYDRPASVLYAELWHVHFSADGKWTVQIRRKAPERRTSNAAIVYCTDHAPWHEHYCLLALLHTHAHEKMRNTNFAITLANLAEDFRKAMDKRRRMEGVAKNG